MEKASKVMYSIANFFTWVVVVLCIAGIVIASLSLANVIKDVDFSPLASIISLSIILIVSLITIAMVRRAKADNSSKGWDVLFIILGVLGGNLFYVLGGIFGLVAPR